MLARLRGDSCISPPDRGALWECCLSLALDLRVIVAMVHLLQELLARLSVRHVLLLN